jgi:O-antigen ligase
MSNGYAIQQTKQPGNTCFLIFFSTTKILQLRLEHSTLNSTEMDKPQLLPAKHVGSFLLLMFIATFKPTAIWPSFPISLEPVSILAIGLMLFYKISVTIGINAFCQQYKNELILLTLYFSVCFLSLYINLHRYADNTEIVRYGITFILISATFPACLFLFFLPNTRSKLSFSQFKYAMYIPWAFIAFISLIALWQWLDGDSSTMLTQFLISGENESRWRSYGINGIFQASTDLASVSALVVFAILCILTKNVSPSKNKWFVAGLLLVVSLIIVIGVLGGKRVFILAFFFGFTVILMKIIKTSLPKKILYIIAGVFVIHLLMLLLPDHKLYKIFDILPYLKDISNGVLPDLSSFVPQLSRETLGPRVDIWQRAIEAIGQHWFLGISNGGFRLGSTIVSQNTHNLILQIMVVSGVVGLSLLLLLLATFLKRNNGSSIKTVTLLLVCSILMVDYFPDHSLPWIIIVSYLIMMSWQKFEVPKGAE